MTPAEDPKTGSASTASRHTSALPQPRQSRGYFSVGAKPHKLLLGLYLTRYKLRLYLTRPMHNHVHDKHKVCYLVDEDFAVAYYDSII